MMDYATGYMCARCRMRVDQIRDCLGESGIYSPTGRAFTLCEQCFLDEDAEIDRAGTNDIPERLDEYRANLRAGPLPARAALSRSPKSEVQK